MTVPTTEKIRARPVWARYLQRRQLEQMAGAMGAAPPPLGAPTDEEKADAIEILRDVPEWLERIATQTMHVEHIRVTEMLIAEAERIWLEGSIVNEREAV